MQRTKNIESINATMIRPSLNPVGYSSSSLGEVPSQDIASLPLLGIAEVIASFSVETVVGTNVLDVEGDIFWRINMVFSP